MKLITSLIMARALVEDTTGGTFESTFIRVENGEAVLVGDIQMRILSDLNDLITFWNPEM